jgi:hypothetical protein
MIGSILPAAAQQAKAADTPAQWQYKNVENPMTGKSSDMFLLEGRYLTPPSVGALHVPDITVQCADGKFKGALLEVGAVVQSPPPQRGVGSDQVIVDMRLDENKPTGNQWRIGNDRQTLFFDEPSLTKLLTGRMLWGRLGKDEPLTRRVRLSVGEALSNQVVMQFDMPQDATQLVQSCGLMGRRNGRKK